jgi:hypothetical protein
MFRGSVENQGILDKGRLVDAGAIGQLTDPVVAAHLSV